MEKNYYTAGPDKIPEILKTAALALKQLGFADESHNLLVAAQTFDDDKNNPLDNELANEKRYLARFDVNVAEEKLGLKDRFAAETLRTADRGISSSMTRFATALSYVNGYDDITKLPNYPREEVEGAFKKMNDVANEHPGRDERYAYDITPQLREFAPTMKKLLELKSPSSAFVISEFKELYAENPDALAELKKDAKDTPAFSKFVADVEGLAKTMKTKADKMEVTPPPVSIKAEPQNIR